MTTKTTRRSVLAGIAGGAAALPALAGVPTAANDPVMELASRYHQTLDMMNAEGVLSDDEVTTMDERVLTPIEAALIEARPTTRQGVIAILKIAADRASQFQYGSPETCWGDRVQLALIENARDAVLGGAS